MGKAMELSAEIDARRLTAAEIAIRQAAIEAGGEVEATHDGRLIKRHTPAETPKVVMRAPQGGYD